MSCNDDCCGGGKEPPGATRMMAWWRDKTPKGWSFYHSDLKHGVLLTPEGQMVTVNKRYAEAMADQIKQAHMLRLTREAQLGIAEAKEEAKKVKIESPRMRREIDGRWVKFDGEATPWNINEVSWSIKDGVGVPNSWQVIDRHGKIQLETGNYDHAVRFIQLLMDVEMRDGMFYSWPTDRQTLHPVRVKVRPLPIESKPADITIAKARIAIDCEGKVYHYGELTGFIVVHGQMAWGGLGWMIFDRFKNPVASSRFEGADRSLFDILCKLSDKGLKLGELWGMHIERTTPAWARAMRKDKR